MGKKRGPRSINYRDTSWMREAACRGMATAIFYPNETYKAGRAAQRVPKTVCAACPVKEECRDYSLATEPMSSVNRFGIWGGMDEAERERLARARAAGKA